MTMKLHEIKKEISAILNNVTLDDLYASSIKDLVRDKFFELTGIVSTNEIEKYLLGRFPETSPEMLGYNTNLEITAVNDQIDEINKSQQDSASTKLEITDFIKRRQREISDSIEAKEELKSKILEVENEIVLIMPLAEKLPYSDQLLKLQKKLSRLANEQENNYLQYQKLKESIHEYEDRARQEEEYIAKFDLEIKSKETLISKYRLVLEDIQNRDKTLFEQEYDALAFFYKLFLNKSIRTYAEKVKAKTGEIITDQRGRNVEEEKIIETGKIDLITDELKESEYFQFVISLVKVEANSPKNWRRILLDIFDNPLPDLAGTISQIKAANETAITQKSMPLHSIDTSALLALSVAFKHGNSLNTRSGDIILGLSGGISARINIREKGELIRKVFDDDLRILANCTTSDRFKLQVLYRQTGYADSNVEIATPAAYTLYSGNFAIDIHFDPAPILFDSHSAMRFTPNISGLAKEEDELIEEDA